jgi:hypothetical protein
MHIEAQRRDDPPQGQGDSGSRYRISDTFVQGFHFDSDSAPNIFTQIIVSHVIAQGPSTELHRNEYVSPDNQRQR